MDGVSSAIQLLCRGLSLGAKGRLHFACVYGVTGYGSETWPVKEEDVIGLEMNDARTVRWMCKVGPEDTKKSRET